jgi:S1-C subfamily serine protease
VEVSERQSDIISRLPLRGSLTLMGTGIKSEAVDRIRNRLVGLEIQYRMGGFLGVSCYADDQECKVSTVHAGTAAFEAGLVFHDVIVGAGDDEVTSFSTLQKAINQHVAGEEIEIRFLRGKKLMKAKVRLGRLKDN